MGIRAIVDLTTARGNAVLTATDDPDEVVAACTGALRRHDLRLRGRSSVLSAWLVHVPLGDFSFNWLHHGADVTVLPTTPEEDNFLLVLPVADTAHFLYGVKAADAAVGAGVIVGPCREFEFAIDTTFDQVVVRLDRSADHRLYRRARPERLRPHRSQLGWVPDLAGRGCAASAHPPDRVLCRLRASAREGARRRPVAAPSCCASSERGDGSVVLPFAVWRDGFFNDGMIEQAQEIYGVLRPQPYGEFTDPADTIGWEKVPPAFSYLAPYKDNDIIQGEGAATRAFSNRLGVFRLVGTGGSHEVLLTNPEYTAMKLIEAGRDRSSATVSGGTRVRRMCRRFVWQARLGRSRAPLPTAHGLVRPGGVPLTTPGAHRSCPGIKASCAR